MKKYISLLVVLFCFVGSVWGQTVTLLPANAACYGGSDGSITVKITDSTEPYDIRLYRGGVLPIQEIKNTTEREHIFTGLIAAGYTVRVCKPNSNTSCVQKATTIGQPRVFQFFGTPQITNGSCNTNGSIRVSVSGGTTPYTYTLTLESDPSFSKVVPTSTTSVEFDNLEEGTYIVTVADNGCDPIISDKLNLISPPAMGGEIFKQINILCKGQATGSIRVTAFGGTPPYYYVLDYDPDKVNYFEGYFDQLEAGPHVVTIIDGSSGTPCSADVDFIITEPLTSVSAIIKKENITSCNGDKTGSLTITGQGGTPGKAGSEYTYSIDNGVTFPKTGPSALFDNLGAKEYNISVKDSKGCEFKDSKTITEPDPISFSTTPTPNNCAGENEAKIEITNITGGTAPIQFQLEKSDGTIVTAYQNGTSFTDLEAGTYIVRAKDSKGCIKLSDNILLTDPAKVTVNTYTTTPAKCFGEVAGTGSITITGVAGGDNNYQYRIDGGAWQTEPLFENLTAATYKVEAIDGKGCISDLVNITVGQLPKLEIKPTDIILQNLSCADSDDGSINVTATGGTAPYIYSMDGITFLDNGGLFKNLSAGPYTIYAKDANGCTASTETITLTKPVDVKITSVVQTPDPIQCATDPVSLIITATGEPGRTLEFRINDNTWSNLAPNPHTYELGPGSGRYKVEVRYAAPYNTCKPDEEEIQVTAPDPLQFTTAFTPIACAGATGKIKITAYGGTAPYTFTIKGPGVDRTETPGATFYEFDNLPAGTYEVNVTDQYGCNTPQSEKVVLKDPETLTIKTEHKNTLCIGDATGSITITASGGTAPYIYTISPNAGQLSGNEFSKLPVGTYEVTVTDANGCFEKESGIKITAPEEIKFTAKADNENLSCDDAVTFITVTITAPLSGSFIYRLVGHPDGWKKYNAANPASNIIDKVGKGKHTMEVAYDYGNAADNEIAKKCAASEEVIINPITVDFGTTKDLNNCFGEKKASITIKDLVPPSFLSEITFSLYGPVTILDEPYVPGLKFDNLPGGDYRVVARVVADGCTVDKYVDLNDPSPVTIDESLTKATMVSCNGAQDGTITIVASGDNQPFTYSISPANGTNHNDGRFTGLSPARYTITVTDSKGCIPAATTQVSITESDALLVTYEKTGALCHNGTGSITLTVKGGNAPYIYEWAHDPALVGPVAADLVAGRYTVIVWDKDKICSETLDIEIEQPDNDLLLTLLETVGVTCFNSEDGKIIVKVTGGTAPYKVQNNGQTIPGSFNDGEIVTIDKLWNGVYKIIVTDANNCTYDKLPNVPVSQPEPLIGYFAARDITCNGANNGELTIKVKGGKAPYSYAWNTGATVEKITKLAPGKYIVTVTDSNGANGCVAQFDTTLTQPDIITVSVLRHIPASCKGASDGEIEVSVKGGTVATDYIYAWTGPDGFTANTKEITSLKAGTYYLNVTDDSNCSLEPERLKVTISEPDKIENIKITADPVAVDCANEDVTLTVTADGSQPLAFSLDGINWQTNNTFVVKGGQTYTIHVGYWVSATEAHCAVSEPVTIAGRKVIDITGIDYKNPLECDEVDTKVTITALGDGGSLLYHIDGKEWQAGNEFTGIVPGSYTVSVKYADDPGCPATEQIEITTNVDIKITDVIVSPLACADSDVRIEIIAEGNGAPLEYSIGGNFYSGNVFEGLEAKDLTVYVRYVGTTCAQRQLVSIKAPKAIVLQTPIAVGKNPLDCATDVTTITAVATDWEPGRTVEYSINGTDWNTTGLFPGVGADTYQVQARYKAPDPACAVSEEVTINAPAEIQILSATAARTELDCDNEVTTITIEARGQAGYTLEYSIDNGGSWQPSPVFDNVGKGTYHILVRYGAPFAPCQSPTKPIIKITAPDLIQITAFKADNLMLNCSGPGSTTTITITAVGSKPMEYSIDGGLTWEDNNGIFLDKSAGGYTACARYIGTSCFECYRDQLVIEDNNKIKSVTIVAVKPMLNCDEKDKTTILVTVDPPSPDYEYRLNGGGAWKSKDGIESELLGEGSYFVTVRDKNDPTCTKDSPKDKDNILQISKLAPISVSNVKITEAPCFNTAATIEVTARGNDVMLFSLTPQVGPAITNNDGKFMNVPEGVYTLTVAYLDPIFATCSYTHPDKITIVIPDEIEIKSVDALVAELKCNDEKTTITVTATGSMPMQYRLLNGPVPTPWQDSKEFTVGAGSYIAEVRYKTTATEKCTVAATAPVIITEWAPLIMTIVVADPVLECDQPTTTITVTAQGEAGKAFDFSIDGTNWVTNGTNQYIFTVAAGQHTPSVRYQENTQCFIGESKTIDQNIDITIDKVTVDPPVLTCADSKTTIDIDATGNGKVLEYSINGIDWQFESLFTNVVAGEYLAQVRYWGETCAKRDNDVLKIVAPDKINIISVTPASPIELACPESPLPTITIDATGSQELEYSIRKDQWQTRNTFPNVGKGDYTVKVRYKDGAGCEEIYKSSVSVFVPARLEIISVVVDPDNHLDCFNEKATITINATGEQKIGYEPEYSIDGGTTWQASNVFPNKTAGTYQPRAQYKNHTCNVAETADIEITAPDIINVTTSPVTSPLACASGVTTKINVVATGSYPMEYSLDEATWVADPADLPEVGVGAYTVYVRYAAPFASCQQQAGSSVLSNSTIQGVTATADKLDLSCDPADKARITATVAAYDHTKTLQYRINKGAWQLENEFMEGGGSWIIEVSYVGEEDCVQPSNELLINQLEPITFISVLVDHGKTELDCNGDKTNITINVNADPGKQIIYTLTINGVDITQINNNKFNVGAGTYTIKVSYAGQLCETPYDRAVTITEPQEIKILNVATVDPLCEGEQGIITVSASGDPTRRLEYSANGIDWQTATQIMVPPNTYDVQVRYQQPDFPACTQTYIPSVTIAAPDVIDIINFVADKTTVDCSDPTDKATITITASTTSGRILEYSFDEGVTFGAATSQQVISGRYQVIVRFADAPHCPKTSDELLIQGSSDIQFSNITTDPILCNGGTGSISVTLISTANDLQLSRDGGTTWVDVTSGIPHTFTDLVADLYTIQARKKSEPLCVALTTKELINPEEILLFEISRVNPSGCDAASEVPGSVTIGITNGTAPYEYRTNGSAWTDVAGNEFTATGLFTGEYNIEVRSKNSTCPPSVEKVKMSNPDVMLISATVQNVRCFGESNGEITVSVSGGHAPYTITVNGETQTLNFASGSVTFSGLEGGSPKEYAVKVVDSKNCEKTVRKYLFNPVKLDISIVGTNICPGLTYGEIEKTETGGWDPVTVSWYKNGVLMSPAPNPQFIDEGEYQLIAVDFANCTAKSNIVNIIKLTELDFDEIITHGVACQNTHSGSVKVVNPTGGANGYYEYRVLQLSGEELVGFENFKEWPGDFIFGLPKGNFKLQMRDHKGGGCPPKDILITIGDEDGISIDKISVTDIACFGEEAKIIDIKVSGTTNALEYRLEYLGVQGAWQDAPVFEGLVAGDYKVWAQEKAGGNGCVTNKDTTITAPAQLNLAVTATEPKCDVNPAPGKVDVVASGGTGQLVVTYNGTGLTGIAGNPAINEWIFTHEIIKGGKAIITVTDDNGCTDSDTIDVPYTAGLEFDFAEMEQPNKCPDDKNATIKALARSISGYVPGSITYELYKGIATIPANRIASINKTDLTEPAIFTGLANGEYTLSAFDDKNPQACFTEDRIIKITNTDNIELKDINIQDNTCLGKKDGGIQFAIHGDPSNTSYKYSINGSGLKEVSTVNGVAMVKIQEIPGQYEVTIYYGDCVYVHPELFTIGVKLTVDPQVTPVAVTGCFGEKNGAIEIKMPNTNNTPYGYWYSNLNAGEYNDFIPEFSDKTTIASLGSGDYEIVVKQNTNQTGDHCMSDTIRVTVADAPRLQVGYTETEPITCKGNYGTVELDVTGGSGSYTATVVSYPTGTEAPLLTGLTLSHVTGGLYKIEIIDNVTGCIDVLDLDINAPKLITIEVSHTDLTCATASGQMATIDVKVTKPASGTFVYDLNGMVSPATSDLSYSWSVEHTGEYQIVVTDQDSKCFDDGSISVVVAEPMLINATEEQIDPDNNCQFISKISFAPSGGQLPYTIYFDGKELAGTETSVDINGSYPVKLVDATGCTKDSIINVTLPTAMDDFEVIKPTPECNANTRMEIEILTLNKTYTYQWYRFDPDMIEIPGETTRKLVTYSAGKYMASISNGACKVDTVISIEAMYNVNAEIAVMNNKNPEQICPGEELKIRGSIDPSVASGYWEYPDNTVELFDPNAPDKTLVASSGKIKLVASLQYDNGVCSDTATLKMNTYPVPTVVMAEDSAFIPKDQVYTLHTTVTGEYDPSTVKWTISGTDKDPGYGLNITPIAINDPGPGKDNTYILVLTIQNQIGCVVSDSIFVSRARDFFIPNIFTPNGDGIHDLWMFRNIEEYLEYYEIEVAIFNRGGVQVYSGKGYDNSRIVFDGRNNGSNLPIGTYYYIVKVGPDTYTGSVTILR